MTASTDPLTDAFREAVAGDHIKDIGEAALLMSALDRRDADLGPYRAHLAELARKVRRHRDVEEASVRGQIIADILTREMGYEGESTLGEHAGNANLLNVIDRRCGLPVSLGILYLHTARAAGWQAHGMSFPGQFLVQVEGDDGVTMIDPAEEGREMQPADIYSMLYRMAGRMAKLEESHMETVADQSVLIRMLSISKALAMREKDFSRALELLDRMLVVAPDEASFLYEQARVLTREGRPMAAKRKLEAVIALDPKSPFSKRAFEDLAEVKFQLN